MTQKQGNGAETGKVWRVVFRVLGGLVALLLVPYSLLGIFSGAWREGYLWSGAVLGALFGVYALTGRTLAFHRQPVMRWLAMAERTESGIRVPIVVVEGGDLWTHKSVEELNRELEEPDIDSYRAFDSEGRLLQLGVQGKRITVEETEQVPSHAAELEGLLRKYLTAMRDGRGERGDITLAQLVTAGREVSSRRLRRIL